MKLNLNLKLSNETKLGLLAVAAVTILIVGYNFLKGNNVFSNEPEYYAKYTRVNGLSISKPVLINGFPIGRVSDLKLLPSGEILAQLRMHTPYPIPKNTIAALESTDLLGGKAIVLLLGNNSQLAKNNDTLSTMVQKSLFEQVEPVQIKTERIISRLDSLLQSINTMVGPNFHHNFERSFGSLAKILETTASTSKKIDRLVETQSNNISHIIEDVRSISANFNAQNGKISSILSNLNEFSESAAQSNLAQTVTQVNKTVSELQIILNKINAGQGSLGQLINDKTFYNNLTRAAGNLDKLMIDIKANPKNYVHFSIFGGQKKKPKSKEDQSK